MKLQLLWVLAKEVASDGLKISIGNELEKKKNNWAFRSSSFISEGLISYI